MKTWTRALLRLTALLLVATNLGYLFGATIAKTEVVVVKVPSAMASVDAPAIAKELLTPKNYRCLMHILNKETNGVNPKAKNPDSSARGIGQLLESTYRNLGMRHSNDEKAQLIATLAYIGRKYGAGGPCAAWRFHKTHNYF